MITSPIKPLSEAAQSLPIVESFHSIQGEGTWMGTSAFFIRLAGCDVGCPWCDTKHSWNPKRYPLQSLEAIVQAAEAARPCLIVITGGEPLMHDLSMLTRQLKAASLQVHLETSGAHPFSGTFDWVTFSPKQFKPPHPSVYPHVKELKVIVAQKADLAWAEAQAAKVPSSTIKLLQPEWGTLRSRELVFSYVLQHPEWRVSLQTHKFLGVP